MTKLKLLGVFLSCAALVPAAPPLLTSSTSIGNRLEQPVSIRLAEQAGEDVEITVRSSDPARLRLAKSGEEPGTGSITVLMHKGSRESREFWLQALDSSGTVTYTAEARGYESSAGTVTLAPSAILVAGRLKSSRFPITSGAAPSRITLFSARLDSSLKMVEEQAVAATVPISVLNSNDRAGHIAGSAAIPAAQSSAVLYFQPAAEGEATISLAGFKGFATAAELESVVVDVQKPGFALSGEFYIGENLQVEGIVSLGELRADRGVTVTLTSHDKSKLLLSEQPDKPGSESITLTLPPNVVFMHFFLQALGNSGTVSYTASAPGFRSRTAAVTLAPSGVIITPASQGPPDEAHLLRKEAPDPVHRFYADLATADPRVPLVAWTAQLDPVTHRSADITVQPLRAGVSLVLRLKNSNPAVGQINSELTIPAGSDHIVTHFKALNVGTTEISIETPKNFTPSANATTVIAYVR